MSVDRRDFEEERRLRFAAEAHVRGLEQENKRLREALRRVLLFEASFGENDIPEVDREFAEAALAEPKEER